MKIEQLRNTAALILAAAIKNIYPTARLGHGKATADGFYHDFDFTTPIKTEDLSKIEAEMQRLVKLDLPIVVIEKGKAEAGRILDSAKESYKAELLAQMPRGQKAQFVKLDGLTDMTDLVFLPSTGKLKVFQLTGITGAYWMADAKNKMLTRINAIAFEKRTDMDEYLVRQEEVLKRDHNKIGRELEYFMTVDVVGQGLPHMMPNGYKVLQILQRFVEDEEERRGYMHVRTPILAKKELYELSGHWAHYKDGMFVLGNELLDEEVFALRPMTCPFHFFIYKNSIRSYRDLPMRYGETAILFRNENSGEMHGLTRVRQFTLAEGHIIARPDQVQMVFDECLDLTIMLMRKIGIEDKLSYRLSKWDPKNKKKYYGSAAEWEKSQDELRQCLVRNKLKFVEADGEAAFYGPKIDIQASNVHGKEDTIMTLQLDFSLATRYDMSYVDENGEKARPIIIHRASLGCYERTLAMLIEHYAGALPVWVAPTQAVIMGISNRQDEYATRIYNELLKAGVRIKLDLRPEKVGYKIREATVKKIPYMIVVGDREAENNQISVRTREGGDLGAMTPAEFLKRIQDES